MVCWLRTACRVVVGTRFLPEPDLSLSPFKAQVRSNSRLGLPRPGLINNIIWTGKSCQGNGFEEAWALAWRRIRRTVLRGERRCEMKVNSTISRLVCIIVCIVKFVEEQLKLPHTQFSGSVSVFLLRDKRRKYTRNQRGSDAGAPLWER